MVGSDFDSWISRVRLRQWTVSESPFGFQSEPFSPAPRLGRLIAKGPCNNGASDAVLFDLTPRIPDVHSRRRRARADWRKSDGRVNRAQTDSTNRGSSPGYRPWHMANFRRRHESSGARAAERSSAGICPSRRQRHRLVAHVRQLGNRGRRYRPGARTAQATLPRDKSLDFRPRRRRAPDGRIFPPFARPAWILCKSITWSITARI